MALNPIFIIGYHPTDDGSGLKAYIKKYWHDHWGIDLTMTAYDDPARFALIPPMGAVPLLIGHSHGGAECVNIAKGLNRSCKVLLIDPVPFPNPQPNFPGFDLPFNVSAAWCTWRTTHDGKPITKDFSGPIKSASCPYTNIHYVPKPATEDAEHGERVWSADTGAQAKLMMQ